MDLSTTAGKNVVCVTFAVKDEKENSIALVLDQEIDALHINYTTVASDIELTHDYFCQVKCCIFVLSCVTRQ